MAQTTILAAGTTAATSTDVVVAAGATVTIGVFTAAASGIPGNEGVQVYIDTPGNDQYAVSLTGNKPTLVPRCAGCDHDQPRCLYRVVRHGQCRVSFTG